MSCEHTPTHVLYLHGFRSSPQSMKAQKMAALMGRDFPGVHWWCPQLPPSPRQAMDTIMQGIAHWPTERMVVLGSSLGGYYATAVAQRTGCKGVLLNPAVNPARDLARYIGEQSSWHDPTERFFFQPAFVDELRALDVGPLRWPQQLLAVIAQGDEVLDWREMQARYAQGPQRIVAGSDHALSDFDDHAPAILAHLGLAAA